MMRVRNAVPDADILSEIIGDSQSTAESREAGVDDECRFDSCQRRGRPETSLISSGVTTAHGEAPLSDFPVEHKWVPLGTVAREYREGHPVKREKVTVIP